MSQRIAELTKSEIGYLNTVGAIHSVDTTKLRDAKLLSNLKNYVLGLCEQIKSGEVVLPAFAKEELKGVIGQIVADRFERASAPIPEHISIDKVFACEDATLEGNEETLIFLDSRS